MTQSYTCRKRCRSHCDEESSEFTPLSKRINNLHINNTLLTTASATVDNPRHCNCQETLCNLCSLANHQHPLVGIDTVVTCQWNGLVNGINSEIAGINHNLLNVNQQRGSGNASTQMQQHISRHLQEPTLPLYNPDLTPSENPFYYENNRLLYTLYMERLHRSNNQL